MGRTSIHSLSQTLLACVKKAAGVIFRLVIAIDTKLN
jgi:hypothetical protein